MFCLFIFHAYILKGKADRGVGGTKGNAVKKHKSQEESAPAWGKCLDSYSYIDLISSAYIFKKKIKVNWKSIKLKIIWIIW